MYSSLEPESEAADLGYWARTKQRLLKKWLPDIQTRHQSDDALSLHDMSEAELDRDVGPELMHRLSTVSQLAKLTTPVAIAEAVPLAVQQVSTLGLEPLSEQEQRRLSSLPPQEPLQKVNERPASMSSSGIMIEERNLSDSESDMADSASHSARRKTRSSGRA